MELIVFLLTIQFDECKTEDSNNCYWNAKEHGNGEGRSFIALKDGTIVFIDQLK